MNYSERTLKMEKDKIPFGEKVIGMLTGRLGISETLLAAQLGVTGMTIKNWKTKSKKELRNPEISRLGMRLVLLYDVVIAAAGHGIPSKWLLSFINDPEWEKPEVEESGPTLLHYIVDFQDDDLAEKMWSLFTVILKRFLVDKRKEELDQIPPSIEKFIDNKVEIETALCKNIDNPDRLTTGDIMLIRAAHRNGMESMYRSVRKKEIAII